MCAVSAVIHDYYKQYPKLPYYEREWPGVYPPIIPTTPPDDFDINKFEELIKKIQKAKKQDIEDGIPDCEKPELIKWLKEVAKKFDILEKKVDEILEGRDLEITVKPKKRQKVIE